MIEKNFLKKQNTSTVLFHIIFFYKYQSRWRFNSNMLRSLEGSMFFFIFIYLFPWERNVLSYVRMIVCLSSVEMPYYHVPQLIF